MACVACTRCSEVRHTHIGCTCPDTSSHDAQPVSWHVRIRHEEGLQQGPGPARQEDQHLSPHGTHGQAPQCSCSTRAAAAIPNSTHPLPSQECAALVPAATSTHVACRQANTARRWAHPQRRSGSCPPLAQTPPLRARVTRPAQKLGPSPHSPRCCSPPGFPLQGINQGVHVACSPKRRSKLKWAV